MNVNSQPVSSCDCLAVVSVLSLICYFNKSGQLNSL